MIGIHTSFLIAFEVSSHEQNTAAWDAARRHSAEGFALAPQVLAEFIHVTTDPRRFERPLTVDDATARALRWWKAPETHQVFPTEDAVELFARWMADFTLGRKRILDTMLAAVYKAADLSLVLTTDTRDFGVFPGMHPVLVSG